jgi:hypothetical protein
MAMRTDFNAQLSADSGFGDELIATSAANGCVKNLRMQIFLHGKPPVSKERGQLNQSRTNGKSKFTLRKGENVDVRKGLWPD